MVVPYPEPERLALDGADVVLVRAFLPVNLADALLAVLIREVAWRQDHITLFGRTHPVPRLQQWYGDPGLSYRWSGIHMEPLPWFPALDDLRRRVFTATGRLPNAVLCNLYRNGHDTVGWHADDEPELGPTPFITSVSLGVERDFQMKPKHKVGSTVTIPLPHGSLLVMGGATQSNWVHCLPRRKRITEPRLNLTFRTMPV
jgi:alkylated DNA repair dioxygenase AlkB